MGRFSRASKGSNGRDGLDDLSSDIFEQNEHSLLGEALRKPVGLLSALLLVASAGLFIANQISFHWDRINDFALVGFFVGGGVLLSVLLRAGDTAAAPRSLAKKGSMPSRPAQDAERVTETLIIEDDAPASTVVEQAKTTVSLERRQAAFPEHGKQNVPIGLAETAPATPPVPPEALVEPDDIVAAPDPIDDEVSNFQQALVHYVNAGDFHGQGEVLRRLGHLAKGRGHLKESRQFYMNARACFRKIDDHYAEAAVLLDLGQVLESLDEHDAASAAYRDANRALLDVAMNAGDRYNAVQAHAAD
ncbi:MAG: tetratricopeptide repeat protein [Pseudomonadota bacterium]